MVATWNSAGIAALLTHEQISSNTPRGDTTRILNLTAEKRAFDYDSICVPLTTDQWRKRWTEMCLLPDGSDRDKDMAAERRAEAWRTQPGFLHDEVTMTRIDEAEGVTVILSDWLELDATDDWVRHDSEIALQQELSYATYLNVKSAILPAPRYREHIGSYARAVNACLKQSPYIQLSVRLPIYDPSELQQPQSPQLSSSSGSGSGPRVVLPSPLAGGPDGELNATWEMWDVIRSMCDYNTRLTLTLDLTPPLPTVLGVLNKWAAESVQYIFLPASTFIANTKGYPVLPKATQSFIRETMTHRPTVILGGASTGLHTRGGESAYLQYVRHLEKTSPALQAAQSAGTVENFAQGYQDYLQAPLQPLMDNLPSVTYQTFEMDPVKYKNYEEAMYRALVEWPTQERVVFCVAGAGRGPLVARCLIAIERAQRSAFVYAVEKNPNAYVTLQKRQEVEWFDKVKLLFGDMRSVEIPEPADILVTELLGSFGDNELSPECLDGAIRFLKPSGISIPSSYTAHLAPLSSAKLFNEARAGRDEKSTETPYVVMFQAVSILSGDGGGVAGRCGPKIQECWEFEHPRRDAVLDDRGLPLTNSHNTRTAKLNFHIPHAGVLHGLAGYFEAVLYQNVGLSIHPLRKEHISKDMLSWFPLFFPFKDPLYLPSNSELQVSIWRLTNQRQVWYEWHAESFLPVINVAPAANNTIDPMSQSSLFAQSSMSLGTMSPLIDAESDYSYRGRQEQERRMPVVQGLMSETAGMVKIGHTALHNPGGRSSWIGL